MLFFLQVMRKTKRVCETASKKVRQALIDTDGKLSCYYTFIGKLPAIAEHNHPVGEVSHFDLHLRCIFQISTIKLFGKKNKKNI